MNQTGPRVSRRAIVAAAASGLAVASAKLDTRAQDAATPLAGEVAPGVALARVRKLPTAELNQAIYPDVMRTFLPVTAVVPGFFGYLFAFDAADPTASLTLTVVQDAILIAASRGSGAAMMGRPMTR